MGSHVPLTTIRSVLGDEDKILFINKYTEDQVIDPHKVASLVSMMKQTVQSGTAKAIYTGGFTVPAAGKTGTTSDNKDAWFSGFTSQRTTVVWVGYDTPTPNGLTGASGAVPLWLRYMKAITPVDLGDFNWPEGSKLEKKTGIDPEDPSKEIELIL